MKKSSQQKSYAHKAVCDVIFLFSSIYIEGGETFR